VSEDGTFCYESMVNRYPSMEPGCWNATGSIGRGWKMQLHNLVSYEPQSGCPGQNQMYVANPAFRSFRRCIGTFHSLLTCG